MSQTIKKLVCAGVLLSVVICLSVISFTEAENSGPVDWVASEPVFKQATDYATRPELMGEDCKMGTHKVYGGITPSYLQYCTVPTSMGLMDKNGRVLQPTGHTTTYPIVMYAGGGAVLIPIQNQKRVMQIRSYPYGPGITVGFFNDLSTHVKFISESGGKYYVIEGTDTYVDVALRYTNDEPVRIGTSSFSSNGRYMLADTIWSGIVRVDLNDLSMQPIADSLPRTSGNTLLPASTRIDDSGQTAAIAYNAPGDWGEKYFKLIDIASCTNAMPSDPRQKIPVDCKTVDVLPRLKQLLPTVFSVDNVRFANSHTITFTATYKNDVGETRYADYSMTANGWPTSIKQYLALGDSYISGEGAHSYRDGTDTTDNQCHQSLVSYPYLLGLGFSSSMSVACSGARINNIKDGESASQVPGDLNDEIVNRVLSDHSPGYIAQHKFIDEDNPEAVTISIGGNDIGFGSILEKCVHPTKNLQDNIESASTCYDTYEDRVEIVNAINGQFTRLRELYKGLKENGMGGRRVYVIGYPQIAKVGGDCGLNVQMNTEEVKFGSQLIAYLNKVIKQAADEAGVYYVDTQQAFNGYRLCEASAGQAAMNGFTISRTPSGGYDFKASFHPNQRGHQLLADHIKNQTASLTKPMPATIDQSNEIALDPNLDILQGMSKTNRPIRYLRIVENLTGGIVERASPVNIVMDGKEYLTKAGASYNVMLNSQPVDLGNFTADANGSLAISPVIPASVPPGFHTLHVYGNDIFGNPLDIQQVIFVAANEDDKDGDGVANAADSCVFAVQSNVDIDQDNIDDVCDPLILAAPVTDPNQEPDGIVWLHNAILPVTIQTTSGE